MNQTENQSTTTKSTDLNPKPNMSSRQEWEERQKLQTKRKILWSKNSAKVKKTSNTSFTLVEVKRVVNVTKGGRRFRFFAIAVAGNRAGLVGIGSGKANEVSLARDKAFAQAEKNMIFIPSINDTITHTVSAKFCASKIMLKPASKGSGLIIGGAARSIIELLGIKNITGKSFASNNRMNLLRATLKALKQLRTPKAILVARGLIPSNNSEGVNSNVTNKN